MMLRSSGLLIVFIALIAFFAPFHQITPSRSEEIDSLFRQANDLYAQAHYEEAITLYQLILARGTRNPAVSFNLASAWQALDDSVRALLYYRRAQCLLPRDQEIRNRIETLYIRLQGNIPAVVARPVPFSTDELGWLALIIWTLGFALLLFKRLSRMLRFPAALILISAAMALAYTGFSRQNSFMVVQPTFGYVGPDSTLVQLTVLSPGDEIIVLEQRDGWGRAQSLNGRQFWIDLQFAESISC